MPGPIHGVLIAGSSHIHLGVDKEGRGGGSGGGGGQRTVWISPATPLPPQFPALLLKNKTNPKQNVNLRR